MLFWEIAPLKSSVSTIWKEHEQRKGWLTLMGLISIKQPFGSCTGWWYWCVYACVTGEMLSAISHNLYTSHIQKGHRITTVYSPKMESKRLCTAVPLLQLNETTIHTNDCTGSNVKFKQTIQMREISEHTTLM